MLIVDLFSRRASVSQWKYEFMRLAIGSGLSFLAAEQLADSKRAIRLRDSGLSADKAWNVFENN